MTTYLYERLHKCILNTSVQQIIKLFPLSVPLYKLYSSTDGINFILRCIIAGHSSCLKTQQKRFS